MRSAIRKGEKGYVLTWDAVIALVFVLLILAGFLSIPYFRSLSAGDVGFERVHYVVEDVSDILDKAGPVNELGIEISKGNFSNNTELAAGEIKGASQIAKEFLDPLVPRHMGYALVVGDQIVYSTDLDGSVTDRPKREVAREETRAVRMASGLKENESVGGWVARAMLLYNKTGEIRTLNYKGVNRTEFLLEYPEGGPHEELAYLIAPLVANFYDAKMNLTWSLSEGYIFC
ncbi:MAG: hypothetical protein ABH851_02740 [Methanobacteriota archaeon]